MNISKATKQALIPIENRIRFKKIEYAYQLDNKGHTLSRCIGSAENVTVRPFKTDYLVVTHNHPYKTKRFCRLSPNDLKWALMVNCREMRAVTKDGFCHLVEIPKLDTATKIKCYGIIAAYKYLVSKNGASEQLYRKLTRELEKAGGLKFRTVLLPKTEVSSKTNLFSKLWRSLFTKIF